MRAALSLARRGLGRVWPNPAVGCVLVRDGLVVGRGWTQPGGRPHAETEALARAGDAARGGTAYITLEPCDHVGRTPPCSLALIEAGIKKAVVAVEDPDPRTKGQGIRRLRDAGIEVTLGEGGEEASRINTGFFLRIREGRPLFTLKTATSLDGRIASHRGDSKWITGPESRAFAHLLRAEHDAVMVGLGTALADDPQLTCRLAGMEDRSPLRIISDSRMRLPLTSRLVATARETPTWLITLPGGDKYRREAYENAGVTVIEAEQEEAGRPDLKWLARELGRRGLTRVLVEGGGHLNGALLAAGLIDQVAWFHAPKLIGGDGVPAATGFGIDSLDQAPEFVPVATMVLGCDRLTQLVRKEN